LRILSPSRPGLLLIRLRVCTALPSLVAMEQGAAHVWLTVIQQGTGPQCGWNRHRKQGASSMLSLSNMAPCVGRYVGDKRYAPHQRRQVVLEKHGRSARRHPVRDAVPGPCQHRIGGRDELGRQKK
jgi:hypothetical protein